MNPCDCTKLTGECCHDCPDCGGEGIIVKRKSKLSSDEIDELLERSADGVKYLRESLEDVFKLPRQSLRLR